MVFVPCACDLLCICANCPYAGKRLKVRIFRIVLLPMSSDGSFGAAYGDQFYPTHDNRTFGIPGRSSHPSTSCPPAIIKYKRFFGGVISFVLVHNSLKVGAFLLTS